jgi:hypothetical protein
MPLYNWLTRDYAARLSVEVVVHPDAVRCDGVDGNQMSQYAVSDESAESNLQKNAAVSGTYSGNFRVR